jgi:acetylserotonin O-methyltransferase
VASREQDHPGPKPIIELIEAFRRSKVMFAALSLGVFDRLDGGPKGASQLAKELRLDSDALTRLVDACVGLKLVCKSRSGYRNLPVASTYLCRTSAQTLAGYALYSNRVLYRLWGNLEDAVREGRDRWQQTFGNPGPIFDHLFRTEEAKREFLAGMHGYGILSSPRVVRAFDLGRFRQMVDLGGATGHLACAACEHYPKLRATVFDLPAVVEVGREYVSKTSVAKRIEFVAGDFFADELPSADLYSLGRIIHDWSEEKILRLLGKIHARLPAGGALLVAERLLDPDKAGPVSTLLQSLNMLIATEGKERTAAEYRALLRAAGFAKVQARITGAPLDAVLAIKK